MRTKKHKVNISFNDPGVDHGTEVSVAAHLVGSHYNMFKVRMNQYAGCFDKTIARLKDKEFNPETCLTLYVEFVLGKLKNAASNVEKLEDALYLALKNTKNDLSEYINPIFYTQNGNITMGFSICHDLGAMYEWYASNFKVP